MCCFSTWNNICTPDSAARVYNRQKFLYHPQAEYEEESEKDVVACMRMEAREGQEENVLLFLDCCKAGN